MYIYIYLQKYTSMLYMQKTMYGHILFYIHFSMLTYTVPYSYEHDLAMNLHRHSYFQLLQTFKSVQAAELYSGPYVNPKIWCRQGLCILCCQALTGVQQPAIFKSTLRPQYFNDLCRYPFIPLHTIMGVQKATGPSSGPCSKGLMGLSLCWGVSGYLTPSSL